MNRNGDVGMRRYRRMREAVQLDVGLIRIRLLQTCALFSLHITW